MRDIQIDGQFKFCHAGEAGASDALVVAVAEPLLLLGGPVLPPVLAFLGLPADAGK